MDTRADSLRRWQALDGEGSTPGASRGERFADDYSSALASSLLREWAGADASIRKAMVLVRGTSPLLPDVRAERAVRLLQVQSLIDRGDVRAARAVLSPLAQPGNTSRPVLLLSAQIALVMGRTGDGPAALQSADQLQTWVAQYPLDAEAWLSLSRVRTQLGQGLQSLRADAESRYALGDLPGAIERLRAGRRLAGTASGAGDFVELSVIDARLRTIEAQRKQQLLDAKNF
jgi:predicted Zn-dependent protease